MDNVPNDPITMTIVGLLDNTQLNIATLVGQLNLGQIASVKVLPVMSSTGKQLTSSYCVVYSKWNPTGYGAKVRQGLQRDGKFILSNTNGRYLFTVTYRRHIKESKHPIKLKCPYSIKT